ncbi:hypothetical protein MC7420_5740 [Coleofasciculus chthonoplastes PCC 7420]|uniref:Uncharacterized protein n=1 Tax=Coleofasciculus chthonoplastes PCC 7420 TaxID=118168 RepID=B4VVQ8_9CYAN|nr:hypothetical protein MC7420_5740 [Coleofasciculus chthonoplastes PCC 7420]
MHWCQLKLNPLPPAPLPRRGYALPTSFLNIVRSRFQAVS